MLVPLMCEMNGALTYPAADTALVARESAPPTPRPPRLLDRVRDAVRARHYSRRTEKAYCWSRKIFRGSRDAPRVVQACGGRSVRLATRFKRLIVRRIVGQA